ncbi:MAG: 16S rRNA (guanine(966)-N(2))-methyltransferase RsmD [Oscillospiraceae bacterium]|nr:16S rRNA (guanine(966)-N(2))-methyltransferase RsmD [Oscillospiraceae bacterium]
MARVISGSGAGYKLKVNSDKKLRPTTSRVKEALFDIIQFDIRNSIFLDLFSGSGQIGVEAISRGAKKVIFVEQNRNYVKTIKENVEKILNNSKVELEIINCDVVLFLKKLNYKADIIFLDPPFSSDLLEITLPKITRIVSENGFFIAEAPSERRLEKNIYDFTLLKKYKYGKISLNLYCKF